MHKHGGWVCEYDKGCSLTLPDPLVALLMILIDKAVQWMLKAILLFAIFVNIQIMSRLLFSHHIVLLSILLSYGAVILKLSCQLGKILPEYLRIAIQV